MIRRTALKSMFLLTLGATTLYACRDKYQAIKELELTNVKPTPEMIDTVEALSLCILPLQKVKGLENHITSPYILQSINDLYEKNDISLFSEGIEAINAYSQSVSNKNFAYLTNKEQKVIVADLNANNSAYGKAMNFAFDTIKNLNIEYALNTEYVLRNARYYQMAPGGYNGCIAVAELTNKN